MREKFKKNRGDQNEIGYDDTFPETGAIPKRPRSCRTISWPSRLEKRCSAALHSGLEPSSSVVTEQTESPLELHRFT